MSWNPFRRLAARSRLLKAENAYKLACKEYREAVKRGDTRSMNVTWAAMRKAYNDKLSAEMVVYPLPPLPRRT